MSVVFKNEIKWPRNQLLLPAGLFGVNVPAGLSSIHVREPNYVDVKGMQAALRSSIVRSTKSELKTVGGTVTASLNVRFANPARQWSRLPPIGGGKAPGAPSQFRFSGGDVFLELTLGIYILNPYKPGSDPIAGQIFSEVYSHELLHVLDEVETLTNWLQPSITTLWDVSKYLIRAQPFTYGSPGQPISIVETAFHAHVQSRIQREIEQFWAIERNRHADLRDSPAQYDQVNNRIQALRIRQANSP